MKVTATTTLLLITFPFYSQGKVFPLRRRRPKGVNSNGNQSNQQGQHGQGLAQPTINIDIPLSEEQKEELLFMREEEKLARDVYLSFSEQYGHRTFFRIANSEQAHMNSMLQFITAYGLEDPVGDNGRRVFTDSTLKVMYDDLIEMGSVGLEEALAVGALIEETDINDLDEAIADAPTGSSILATYERLRSASYKHLRAFVSSLDFLGVDYECEILAGERCEEILN